MEPPGAHVPARWAIAHDPLTRLQIGAAAAATVLAIAATGDVLLLALLLGLAAANRWALAAAVGAGLSVLTRWGTTSLAALAGAQHVLGPAVTVGPPRAAVASGLAAAALVVAPGAPGSAPAFAAAAALLVAGPAVTGSGGAGDLAVRAGATAVALGVTLAARRWAPPRLAGPAAAGLGVVAALAGAGT